jgi:ATP-dependent DNA ligase
MKPMLAKTTKVVPVGHDWIAQPKYDGWRCIAERTENGVELRTRTGKSITSLPYLEDALVCLTVGTIVDGEIVDLDGGETQWNRTQKICSRTANGWYHRPTAGDPPLVFVVFDVLQNGTEDLMREPLRTRINVASAAVMIVGVPFVRMADTVPSTEEYAAELVARGWEGVVCKHMDSPYVPGDRGLWKKYKPFLEVEVVCTGTYEPELGSHLERDGCVGGITFDWTRDDGTVYQGKCAGKMTKDLRADLQSNPAKYVGLVVEVIHWGVTDDGALRHPNYRRFRDPADKPAPNSVQELRDDVIAAARPVPASEHVHDLADRLKDFGKPPKPAAKRMRNYAQMKDEKLLQSAILIEDGHGKDNDDREACLAEITKRGLLPA